MNADPGEVSEDRLAVWLAERDEALAAGWDTPAALPEPIKAGIVVMVRAVRSQV